MHRQELHEIQQGMGRDVTRLTTSGCDKSVSDTSRVDMYASTHKSKQGRRDRCGREEILNVEARSEEAWNGKREREGDKDRK